MTTYTRANGYYVWKHGDGWIITRDTPANLLREPHRLASYMRHLTLADAVEYANSMLPA